MRISEIFFSIQGEGMLAGVPSVFIRTTGCNLRCWFCDTPYTSWEPQGESLTIEEILAQVAQRRTDHVVVTGGEPLLAPDVEELCAKLSGQGLHVTVETAATIFKPLRCDLASLSPKLAGSTPWQRGDGRHAQSHEDLRLQLDVIRAFIGHCNYQLKFVIDQRADVDEVLSILERIPEADRSKVLLMPQGVTSEDLQQRGRWIVEECKRHGFRYCPRMHIDLFGQQRGT